MSWDRVNLAAKEFATPSEPPTLCGLIYAGRRHLVSGPPEALKTMFALIVGLELLRATDETTFALIDFESGPYGTRRMLDDLGASLEEIERIYYVEPDLAPTAANTWQIADAKVSLAIIDAVVGAYGVSGLDDNARKDAEIFGAAWVDPLWKAGVGTLLVDHVTKNSDNRGKFAIGSERKAGRTDVHFGLEPITQLSRGKTGLVKIATHKDRPGWLQRPRAAELELRSDPDTHALSWEFKPSDYGQVDGDRFRPTLLMGRVSERLAGLHEPLSRGAIETSVKGKATYVRQAIDALVEEGFVLEATGPGSSRLYSLIKPFVPSSHPVPNAGRPGSSLSSPPYKGDEPDGDEDAKAQRFVDTYASEVS